MVFIAKFDISASQPLLESLSAVSNVYLIASPMVNYFVSFGIPTANTRILFAMGFAVEFA